MTEKMKDRIEKIIQDELKRLGLIPEIEYDYSYNAKCSICGARLQMEYKKREAFPIPHESVADCLKLLQEKVEEEE